MVDKTVENTSKSFTAEDICLIIETSAKVGVRQVKLADIEISFRENFLYTPNQVYLNGPTENADQPSANANPASPASEHNFRKDPRAALINPDLLDDMRRSQLLMDDPMAFEQEMINAHMRHDDGGSSIQAQENR